MLFIWFYFLIYNSEIIFLPLKSFCPTPMFVSFVSFYQVQSNTQAYCITAKLGPNWGTLHFLINFIKWKIFYWERIVIVVRPLFPEQILKLIKLIREVTEFTFLGVGIFVRKGVKILVPPYRRRKMFEDPPLHKCSTWKIKCLKCP